MSVFIFIDHSEGHVKKASLEALSYGSALAAQLGTTAEGILLGTISTNPAELGKYGVKKIHHAAQASLDHLDARVYAKLIADTVAAHVAALDASTGRVLWSFPLVATGGAPISGGRG